VADFKHRVKKLTARSWGVSMEYRTGQLRKYVVGWFGYYGISEYYRPIPELDEWLRRRIRMCYWKQWRRVRTKVRNLLSMGVGLKMALQHASSGKSYWRMARTPAMQFALNNARLKAQGVPCIHDLWCKAHGYDISSSAPSR
jgi:RNA-directed DNA polymerase